MKKYTSSIDLQKRAIVGGLPRATAVVLGILGYWAQVPGGCKKGPGQPWKWRTYQEIAESSGYSVSTVGRSVKRLKAEQLLQTKRMFNPSRPGETVNGFRLTSQAYIILGLPVPIGAGADSGTVAEPASAPPPDFVGSVQDDGSQPQETSIKNQKESNSTVLGKEEEKEEESEGASDLQVDDKPASLEEVAAILGKVLG